MKPITLYHNSRCSKSRAVFEILESKNISFHVVEYLKAPLSVAELEALLKKLKKNPEEIVRKGEDRFEELNLEQSPPQSHQEWLKILSENPILIERPIVADDVSAVVGRPPENVLNWLLERKS